MGWHMEMELYEANLKKVRSGGTRLWARSSIMAKGWCRRLTFGNEGIEHVWEERLATGAQGSSRGKPCWALGPGLYEAQSAGANEEHYYRIFLVVRADGEATTMSSEFGPAWEQALESGLVKPPSEAQLWGTVRSMCAKEHWHQAKTQLIDLLPQTELRAQLEGYCADIRGQQYARRETALGLARLKGSAKQVAWAEDRRAEYAKPYARAQQALDKLFANYPEALETSSHKRNIKNMEQLGKKLKAEKNCNVWIDGVGLWKLQFVADYAVELEGMHEALSTGQEVVKKKARRFEQDAEEARRLEGRGLAPEISERLREQRKELGIIQRELVEQLGLPIARFSEYERGIREVEHEVLWAWARALQWCVALVDAVDEGAECFPGRGSDELVKLYEKLRISRGISRQEVALQMGWTLEGLEEAEAEVARGQQLSVVQAQLWAHALKWRYELGDYSVPGM